MKVINKSLDELGDVKYGDCLIINPCWESGGRLLYCFGPLAGIRINKSLIYLDIIGGGEGTISAIGDSEHYIVRK